MQDNKTELKSETTTYIGIDVSKLTLDCAIPQGISIKGKTIYNYHKLSNDELGFKQLHLLIEQIPTKRHCILEATGGYHINVSLYLQSSEIQLSVINPLSAKGFSTSQLRRTKTDKTDAKLLSEYGFEKHPALWIPKPIHFVNMQQKLGLLEMYKKQYTMFSNIQDSFKLHPDYDKQSISSIEKTMKEIDQEMDNITKELNEGLQETYIDEYKSVMSIPGIGPKTTNALLLITEGFTKFTDHKALIAYCGLDPQHHESGTSVKKGSHISKKGMSTIRYLLYMCAKSAKRYNKSCKELYERLTQKGKPHKVAMVAICNKLIKQAFAIAKSKSKYDEKHISLFAFAK